MHSIFAYEDYKELILGMIEQHSSGKGYKARMAEAAGCKPAFLSQVLNSHIHLTLDHAANLASFWRLTADESEYFLCLLQISRSSSQNLIQFLNQRRNDLKKKNLNQKNQPHEDSQLPERDMQQYFSTWYFSAIHALVAIPSTNSDEQISGILNLSKSLVTRVLEELQQMQLIERKTYGWVATKRTVHLSPASILYIQHQRNWRQKAYQIQTEKPHRSDLHYTYIQAISNQDAQKIRDIFVEAIEKSRSLPADSNPENVTGICFDYFNLS